MAPACQYGADDCAFAAAAATWSNHGLFVPMSPNITVWSALTGAGENGSCNAFRAASASGGTGGTLAGAAGSDGVNDPGRYLDRRCDDVIAGDCVGHSGTGGDRNGDGAPPSRDWMAFGIGLARLSASRRASTSWRLANDIGARCTAGRRGAGDPSAADMARPPGTPNASRTSKMHNGDYVLYSPPARQARPEPTLQLQS